MGIGINRRGKVYAALFGAMLVVSSIDLQMASAVERLDCRKATTSVEVAVCNNDGLLVLDKEIRDLVDRLNELAAPDPTAQQRIADRWSKWQKALDNGCRSSVKCLTRSYRSGLTNLKQEARRLQRKPAADLKPDPNDKGRELVRFGATDRWAYTGGDGRGTLTEFSDGRALLFVETVAESGAFKYFSEPHAVMIVTDKAGNVIGHASSSALAMRMGGDRTFVQRHSGVGPVKAPEFKAAAFAFFAFKYCGWRQTFERSVGENNGCYQSSQRREYDTFVATLPKALSTLQSTIGKRFEILGWQGMKWR